MVRDLGDLAVSAARAPSAVQQGNLAGVRKAALVMTRAIRQEIVVVTGDSRMSGVNRGRGAKVGAGYSVKGRANPTALIRAKGPLHLIERDTGPRDIRPRRKFARGSRKKKSALKIGSRYARVARHRGTRGQHPFRKGVERTEDRVGNIIENEVWKRVVRSWGA